METPKQPRVIIILTDSFVPPRTETPADSHPGWDRLLDAVEGFVTPSNETTETDEHEPERWDGYS